MADRREPSRWLTTTEAATLAGVSRTALHTLAARALAGGVDLHAPAAVWPDKRTPMWDRGLVAEYVRTRPGRGANLRRKPVEDVGETVDGIPGQLTVDRAAADVERSESNGGE